jgi:tellurite resistance protein
MTAARVRSPRPRRLSPDEGFIALIVAAMDANNHTAPEEAARAQHIVWSMARFRNRNGATVGRLIATMKQMVHDYAAEDVIAAACRAIPARLRGAALAICADVILVDGRVQRDERRFLLSVAAQLKQQPAETRAILDVIRLKNRA